MPKRILAALAVAVAAFSAAARADASPYIQYGVQDDAWLLGGPGTYEERLALVKGLGVDVVRVSLRWSQIAAKRPARPSQHFDPAYDWSEADALLHGLRSQRITPVVTLAGTPRWANGNRAPNWAPATPSMFANFAFAASKRYPWVRYWVLWNEPNKSWQLRPTNPATYTRLILNPGYAALKRAHRANRVGGGVTAPRGGPGSMGPIPWIRGMKAARAKLDAYAHHPYPLRRGETPSGGACMHCATLTMAKLDRLLAEVSRAFGPKRIWLTEYGYQTTAPMGVSQALQARYHAEASLKAYRAPRVDMLINFLIRDEQAIGRWQSGLYTFRNVPKLSAYAFALPLAQAARSGAVATLWGQVRPGSGRQTYRLRYRAGGRWVWLGGTRLTSPRGYYQVKARLPRGTAVQAWSGGKYGVAIPLR